MSDTMTVQYDEGLAEVYITVTAFHSIPAERGVPVTVPTAVGKQLCQQNWHEVKPSKKKTSTKTSTEESDNTTPADTPKGDN